MRARGISSNYSIIGAFCLLIFVSFERESWAQYPDNYCTQPQQCGPHRSTGPDGRAISLAESHAHHNCMLNCRRFVEANGGFQYQNQPVNSRANQYWQFDWFSVSAFGGPGYDLHSVRGSGGNVGGEVGLTLGPIISHITSRRSRFRYWGTSLIPELGFLTAIYPGDSHGAVAYTMMFGFRFRQTFGVVGIGACAHLLLGAVTLDQFENYKYFGFGARAGIHIAFANGIVQIEPAYRFLSEFDQLYGHTFEGVVYIDLGIIIEAIVDLIY